SHDNHINSELITRVTEDRYQGDKAVKYRKCPVCQEFMARRNFGYRSGVVIDRCPKHGVWLDNGELIHLLEWKKAGGQIAHNQRAAEKRKQTPVDTGQSPSASTLRSGSRIQRSRSELPDLEDLVGDALGFLVKSFFR
ncbi:MAG: zf-TFIIB domain-containing protein, partial [Halopseudomonas sp.]